MLERVRTNLLVTRPYSWINPALIGVTTELLLRDSLAVTGTTVLVAVLAVLGWIVGNTLPEYMRKTNEYGEAVGTSYYLLPFSIWIVVSVWLTPATIGPILLFVVGLALYGLKTCSSAVGKLSFLFRPLPEVALVWYTVAVVGQDGLLATLETNQSLWWLLLTVFAVTASRNIVGDIRDLAVDTNTLAAYDYRIAGGLAVLLAGVPLAFYHPLVVFPVLVTAALLMANPRERSYLLHRQYVFATTLLLFNIIVVTHSSIEVLALSGILYLGFVLNFTYDPVPRKLSKVDTESQ